MYTTRLVIRDGNTHAPLIEQTFKREFANAKTAEKYIEAKVSGMSVFPAASISVYGQVINDNGKIETGIALL
jgi:hypothetical protein